MTTYIALLRGINVGKRQLPMARLRDVATDLGYDGVRTYIQSGNLVFTSSRGERTVAGELAGALAEATGFEVPVIVRSRAEIDGAIAANPFPEAVDQPTHLHVIFYDTTIDAAALSSLDADEFAPERWAVVQRDLYLHLPDGMGRSKLAIATTRALPGGTGRNWRTVLTLAEMAAE